MPLDLLIKGMQNFDGDEKPEKLVPSGRIEGEMAFAIDTFNDMVSQIWNDRILIYEEKLENQKLVIQNLHSHAIAMLAGLVIVPVVSLFTPKPDKELVESAFKCYDKKTTVEQKTALGD